MRTSTTLLAMASVLALTAGTASARSNAEHTDKVLSDKIGFTGTNTSGVVYKYNTLNLPESGSVTVEGTVADTRTDNTFSLTGNANKRIDVRSQLTPGLKKGDKVRVMGEIGTKAAGVGQQIVSENIVRINQFTMTGNNGDVSGTPVMVPGAMATRSAYPAGVTPYNTAASTPAQPSSVGTLPAAGQTVRLTGTVAQIVDQDTFLFRDNSGQTIDVNTLQATRLTPGETVTLNGVVREEYMGAGQQISATQVTTESTYQADADTVDGYVPSRAHPSALGNQQKMLENFNPATQNQGGRK